MRSSATPRLGALAVLFLALAATASSQEHLSSLTGETFAEGHGVVAVIGDVDGDDVPDHAVGAPEADGQRGRLKVTSGATGAELWRVMGDVGGDLMGHAVAGALDVDVDGVPDVVVGLPGAEGTTLTGRVQVRSGVDGALIWEALGDEAGGRFGFAVSALGDVDFDGRPDVLVGAPFESGPAGGQTGAVYALSGGDGHLLALRHGALAGDLLGFALQGSIMAGDGSPEPVIGAAAAGDGSPEPVIGATQELNGGEGYVIELSTADFSELRRHVGAAAGDRFGATVGLAGDVNGDGSVDLIAGADPRDAQGLPAGAGYARVYNGADGALLHTLDDGDGTDGFGASVAGVGDVNGDGFDDVAVGAPESDGDGWVGPGAGTVRLYDGSTGGLNHIIHGAAGSGLGRHLAFAGDVDGDGRADAAVGAPADATSGTASGTVFVFSFARWTNLYGGLPGSHGVPTLAGAGETSPSSTVQLDLSGARPLAMTALVAGTALVYDTGLGLFVPSGEIQELGLVTDLQGDLTHLLPLPAGLPANAVLYYQYVVDDPTAPGGQARSNTVAGNAP